MYATILMTLSLIAQNPEGIRTGEVALVHAFGDRGLTLADGRSGVLASPSPGTYHKLATCLKSNDVAGARQFLTTGELSLVPVGTRVLVREVMTFYDPDAADVRLMDGPNKDEVRTIPVQFLTRNPRLATPPKAKAAKKKPPIRKAAPKTPEPSEPGR